MTIICCNKDTSNQGWWRMKHSYGNPNHKLSMLNLEAGTTGLDTEWRHNNIPITSNCWMNRIWWHSNLREEDVRLRRNQCNGLMCTRYADWGMSVTERGDATLINTVKSRVRRNYLNSNGFKGTLTKVKIYIMVKWKWRINSNKYCFIGIKMDTGRKG